MLIFTNLELQIKLIYFNFFYEKYIANIFMKSLVIHQFQQLLDEHNTTKVAMRIVKIVVRAYSCKVA